MISSVFLTQDCLCSMQVQSVPVQMPMNLQKENWKRHWNFLCGEGKKIFEEGKEIYQTRCGQIKISNFFLPQRKSSWLSFRWGLFFPLFFFLFFWDKFNHFLWTSLLHMTRRPFGLWVLWACISMKSELRSVSASIEKLRIIQWASYQCDSKTHKDKAGIRMHHSAATPSH